jgi:hypothetical protein
MTTKVEKQQAALERRIRRFYDRLKRRDFDQCYQMIDPSVRDQPGSVTLFQYQNALVQFMDRFGPLIVDGISVSLHVDESNKLYEGRDFAVGKTLWSDNAGERHVFSERWVRQGKAWYTRSTGFVAPEAGWIARQGRDEQPPLPTTG